MKIFTYIFSIEFLLIVISITISSYYNGQTITVAGTNWTPTIPTITEAGSNYAGTYQSSTNQITISGELPKDFLSILSSSSAKVSMHYTSTSWHNSLLLYAKRNGGTATLSGGTCVLCSATITGGDTTYIQIPQTVDATFFNINFFGTLGVGNTKLTYSGINAQLQIGGVSVAIPVATYTAQIVFTIAAN